MNSQASPFCLCIVSLYYAPRCGLLHPLPMNFHRAAYKTAEKLPKEAGVKDLLRTLCLLSLVLVVGANGQTTNGNVQGTVVDPQGAIVAGAAVTARNMDTGLKLTATTSNA